MLKSALSLVNDVVSQATDLVFNKTELEKKLDEALSKDPWGASSTLLKELARATRSPQHLPVIMRHVWASLNHADKNWRQTYKGLVLLEALLKHGAERVVDDARDQIFRVRALQDYSHFDDKKDQGAGIREVSKKLLALLSDTELLREERRKAQGAAYGSLSNEGGSAAGHPQKLCPQ